MVRETMPSRSSPRRVTVSMRWLMPSMSRLSSVNRLVRSLSCEITCSDHLSPMRSRTSRARQFAGVCSKGALTSMVLSR